MDVDTAEASERDGRMRFEIVKARGLPKGQHMTLIIDRRVELEGKPGIHALIVGISDYPHLPKDNEPDTPSSFGARNLTSAALTAYEVCKWLTERQDQLSVPLMTCRLMISPSEKEAEVEQQLSSLATSTSVDKFLTAANEWRQDALTDPENVTFFYFAGNGLEVSKTEVVMLFQDFGSGVGPVLRSAVSVNNLFFGMAPLVRQEKIARSQIYFIDTNRVTPEELKHYEVANTTAVFDAERLGIDDRRATIFHAASPGGKAYAFKGGQSLFSIALLNCLNGAAAVPGNTDEEGNIQWQVSIHSLADALGEILSQMGKRLGVEQGYTVSGIVKDWVIHYLEGPPLVEVIIEIEPKEAVPFTRIEVLNDAGEQALELPVPLSPHPYSVRVPGGFYSFGAKVITDDPRFVDRPGRMRLVTPPRAIWKVRVVR